MTDPLLRPLLKGDYAAVVALWCSATDATECRSDAADIADAAAARGRAEHALVAALAAERSVIVAELQEHIAGFVVVDLAAGRVERLHVADASAGVGPCLTAFAATLTPMGRDESIAGAVATP